MKKYNPKAIEAKWQKVWAKQKLNQAKDGERITPERLKELGLIADTRHEIKLLGDGSLTKRVTVVVHRASDSAKAKVAKAGGSVELLAS